MTMRKLTSLFLRNLFRLQYFRQVKNFYIRAFIKRLMEIGIAYQTNIINACIERCYILKQFKLAKVIAKAEGPKELKYFIQLPPDKSAELRSKNISQYQSTVTNFHSCNVQ